MNLSSKEFEALALKYFEAPKNKEGQPYAQIKGHANPHGFGKFLSAFRKGYEAALLKKEQNPEECDATKLNSNSKAD